MMILKLWALLFLINMMTSCLGYEQYQNKIPNGDNVPNPCKTGEKWAGVGHAASAGGGTRNPFGTAFKSILEWTKDFCQADSDGDGKTNGEELGDPDCEWLEGFDPSTTKGITHPGICEPIDSADCITKNKDIDCQLPTTVTEKATTTASTTSAPTTTASATTTSAKKDNGNNPVSGAGHPGSQAVIYSLMLSIIALML